MIVNQETITALSKSFRTLFLEAHTSTVSKYQKFSMVVSSSTRHNVYAWLGNFPMLQEWVGDRVISALKAHNFTITNKSFQAAVEVDRDDLEDDNVGVYGPLFEMLGRGAKLHPEKLAAALLKGGFDQPCYDGKSFFATDHPIGDNAYSNTGGGSGEAWFLLCADLPIKPLIFQIRRQPELVSQDKPNDEHAFLRKKYRHGVDYRGNAGYGLWQLAYGSRQTLDAAAYATARASIMSVHNDAGDPLNLIPDLLVVPPNLEAAGRKLLLAEYDSAGATNVWNGTADLLVWPCLS